MRLCQLVAGHGEGGLEKHVRDLTEQLLEFGHDAVVMGDKRFLDTLPIQTNRIPVRIDRNRRHPLLWLELLVKLRGCRCDVIHAHANKAASLVAMLKPWLPCPTLGTLHNMKRDVRAFHKLDHVITVSRQLAWSFSEEQASVVYNGINLPCVESVDLKRIYQLPTDLPVLCAVGRLVSAKGFDVLLDAVDGLPLSLIIVGDGPERIRLEQRVARMSPLTHVRLLGRKDNPTSLMASADAVVIASRREGFSYVFNEAVLCNARILATNVPIANEVLPKELIVPTDNASAFREKLQSLLGNMSAWGELMHIPRQTARALMTRREMGANTLEVYRSLVAQKHCQYQEPKQYVS